MPPGPLVWATRSVLQLFPPRAYMLKISRYGLGLSFMMFTKNKEGARANRTTKYKKQMCGRKIYSRTRTFGSKVHKSNIRVKRWHNKYEILNYTERHNFSLNDFSYHVQS